MIFEISSYFSVWLVEILLGFVVLNGFLRFASARSAQKIILPVRFGFLLLVFFFTLTAFILRRNNFQMVSLEGFPKLYFSQTFMLIRFVIDFVIWSLILYFLNKPGKAIGPISVILVLFTGTQFSTDWIISYTPHWSSSGFGLIFLVSSILSAFSFALLKSNLRFEDKVMNDLGLIHFTIIAAWCYLNFMQFLVMWSGNLPFQASWYVIRLQTHWKFLSFFILIFQMLLPLFLLLFKKLKVSIKAMKLLAVCTFICQALFTFLMVQPSIQSDEPIYSLKLLVFIVLIISVIYFYPEEKNNEYA